MQDSHDSVSVQAPVAGNLNDLLGGAPSGSALDLPLTFTTFPSQSAQEKREHNESLRRIGNLIKRKRGAAKGDLPWLKLATFGDLRTDRHCLRHNANLRTISGIEADYDGEAIGMDEAAARLRRAGVAALLYTSASHTPDAPRWRALAPLSRNHDPEEREALCARLNGALGGILTGESFTLSQAYYFGTAETGHPVQTVLVDGAPLDRVTGVVPLGKDGRTWSPRPAREPSPAAPADWSRERGRVAQALEHIPPEIEYPEWLKVAQAMHRASGGCDDARSMFAEWSYGADYSDAPNRNRLTEDALNRIWERAGELPRSGNPVQLGTLFHMAERFGYKPEPIEILPDDFDDLPALQTILPADEVALDAVTGAMRHSETGALVDNTSNHAWAIGKVLKRKRWTLRHNTFAGQTEWNGSPIEDHLETVLRVAVERDNHLACVKKEAFRDAVELVAHLSEYHPVRDYLRALHWDGIPRMDTFLPHYFRSKDDDYTRGVGRCFLIAMVARVMKPGCKHDCALILTGGQGAFKSTAAAILAGGREWFSDSLPAVTDDGREAAMHLPGKWVVELGEMSSLTKASAEAVKAFVSRSVDKVRLPYGRRDVQLRRQCVFIGTSNNPACLRDETGNRRFWPVEVGAAVDIDALARDRDQLLAEAVAAFDAGEQWHLTPELDALARVEQEAARDPDIWEDAIRAWLDSPEIKGDDFADDVQRVARERVKLADVLKDCLGIDTGKQDRKAQNRVTTCLRAIGWKRKHERDGKWWVRP